MAAIVDEGDEVPLCQMATARMDLGWNGAMAVWPMIGPISTGLTEVPAGILVSQ